jgi:hypothetical protein
MHFSNGKISTVKKKLLSPTVTGTHLCTPQVPNTQNSRFAVLHIEPSKELRYKNWVLETVPKKFTSG